MNTNKILMFFKDNLLVIILIVVGCGIFFFAGEWLGDTWASARHAKERDAALAYSAAAEKKADESIKREAVLAERNNLLKEANEAKAVLLKTAASRELRQAASNMEKISADKEEKLDEILKTPDEEQQCQLCLDAKASGIEFEMCTGICN